MRLLIHSEPIDPQSLLIKRENILTGLGMTEMQADNYLLSLIDELIRFCLQICRPVASASIFNDPVISKSDSCLNIGTIKFELNKVVTAALSNSTSLALFAGTCGEETAIYSSNLIRDGQALEGLIVDLIGSEIAEEIAELIHTRVGSEMALNGLNITNRYSPGYCNWPVSDQHKIFGLLQGNSSGIRLTESSLMLPIKSVSGIIGIGAEVIFKGYTCRYCEIEHCLYRNRK